MPPELADPEGADDYTYWCEECCSPYTSDHCPKHDDGPCELCGEVVPKGQSAVEDGAFCGPCAEKCR